MSQTDQPIADFSQCHEGIFRKLDQLSELPALLEPAQLPVDRRAAVELPA